MRKTKILIYGFWVLASFSIGAGGTYYFSQHRTTAQISEPVDANLNEYQKFTAEIFDTIKERYWEKITDEQLAAIYKLGAEKLLDKSQSLESMNRKGVLSMVDSITSSMPDEKKKIFTAELANIVLVNLKPFGRSQLLSEKQLQTISETVQNKDSSTDLYAVLGLEKGASQEDVDRAYNNKIKESGPVPILERAYNALLKPEAKQKYDQSGIEPTVEHRIIKPDIFYMHVKKISPQTLDEFQKASDSTDRNPELKTLVLDLRGNIGGAIDIMPYFLGPFIGPDNYAYDFFHQDEYVPFKTKTGWLPSLVKFKKVVILIDGESQSSAEVMAATLKKYNVGVLIGSRTKGWGTIEQITPIKNQFDPTQKFSLLLVHSLTLREDGQPIEGRGVEPTIYISDKNWPKLFQDYYNSPVLMQAIKNLLK